MGCGFLSVFDYEPYQTDSSVYKHFDDPLIEAKHRMRQSDENSQSVIVSESSSTKDFYELRANCLQRNLLYEDVEFPASKQSIGYNNTLPLHLKWKRPFEICQDPQFIIKPATRFDVMQGKLGNCWLLATLSDLTQNPIPFNHMVPGDQSFSEDYAGIFHFRFWQSHQGWVEVIIDDRLPTLNGQLLFSHSRLKNEFWSALTEKAYAKLKGSYEALNGGDPSVAMTDFHCSLIKRFKLKEEKYKGEKFFNILLHAYKKSCLMTCDILRKNENNKNCNTRQLCKKGLISEHAYSITAVRRVKIGDPYVYGETLLLRIRNPWGTGVEWNGRWSDNSSDWQLISNRRKKELGLTFKADGEFWMSFDDFMENFDTVEICHFESDFFHDETDLQN